MKAANYQTKTGAKNQLYRSISPLTSKMYYDEWWQGKNDVIDALCENGCNVDVWCENGGYRKNSDGVQWKEYKMEIECGSYKFSAILNCHAAGSVEDPFSKYDMSFILN